MLSIKRYILLITIASLFYLVLWRSVTAEYFFILSSKWSVCSITSVFWTLSINYSWSIITDYNDTRFNDFLTLFRMGSSWLLMDVMGANRSPALQSVTLTWQWWNFEVLSYVKKVQKTYQQGKAPLEFCNICIILPAINIFYMSRNIDENCIVFNSS